MSLLNHVKHAFRIISPVIQKNAIKYPTVQFATTTPSGSILPEPKRTRFGFLSVISSVALGLFIGATISKNIANFLEENELFVPSDDDDDDDD